MLLRVDTATKTATRVTGVRLGRFGLSELDLQRIVHDTLDRLLGEDELLPVMRSTQGREEPDLLALDREGRLHIFEVKVWESRSENLLQVLRYGQIFGALDYDGLADIWRRSRPDARPLAEAHAAAFELDGQLPAEAFNRKQVFVVLTNGLDVETRRAVRYWKGAGLDVRPWVYRVYDEGGMLLEIAPYRIADDPLEDQAESSGNGYYVVNTNSKNDDRDERAMLEERRVAAFYSPWKRKIARLHRDDVVFLYSSGVGVVAWGRADGKLTTRPYHGREDAKDEDYGMGLMGFQRVSPPLTAAEMKAVAENPGLVFRHTMFSLDPEAGSKVLAAVRDRTAPP